MDTTTLLIIIIIALAHGGWRLVRPRTLHDVSPLSKISVDEAAAFVGWHEPDKSRSLSSVL
jgi:hypothetical protein